MRKLIMFLLAVAIMSFLIFLQRFFLDQSDTGKEWALMAAWFGLCAWFQRKSETRMVPVCDFQGAAASPQDEGPPIIENRRHGVNI